MAEMVNPTRISVIGEIISVKDIKKDDYKEGKFQHDCKIARLDPLNGSPMVDVFVTERQWDRYGMGTILFEGNVVNVSMDQCIAGETGYVNPETEEWELHKFSLNVFAGADNVGKLGLIGVFGKQGVGPAIVMQFIEAIEELRKMHNKTLKPKAATFVGTVKSEDVEDAEAETNTETKEEAKVKDVA